MSKREPSVLLDDIRTSISEAAKQLPADFKARHSAISWAQIAGLRNRIVHDYAGIDLKLVWHISQTAIRNLAPQIADLVL